MGKTVSSMLILYILCGLVFMPSVCINAASCGVMLCINVIVPSLFPFFVCSKLLVQNGFAERISRPLQMVMRPVFNVPGCGAFAFAVGALSGCPVGAKTVTELYSHGLCSKSEAQRMICFCNNSGPLFIVGSVSVGMLGFEAVGGLLYASHIISAVIVGIIMSFYKRKEKIEKSNFLHHSNTGCGFAETVSQSVSLIGYVCGFVIFFAVVTAVLRESGMIEIITQKTAFTEMAHGVLYGMLEMTNGISAISGGKITSGLLCAVSFVLGFGGLSVILQVRGIISEYGLSTAVFAAAKLVQGILSALVTSLLLSVSKITLPVFSSAAENGTMFYWANSINLYAVFGIIILLLSILSIACKNMRRM